MRSQADTMLNMTSQPSSGGLDVSENGGPSFSMLSGVSDVDVSSIPLPTTRGVSHKTSQLLASLNLNVSIGQTSKSNLVESPSKSFARSRRRTGGGGGGGGGSKSEDQKTSEGG
jgi:hypothetical protein